MYTQNNIVHAGSPLKEIKVVEIKPMDDYVLQVKFSTGELKNFDFKEMLSFPVFDPLKNASKFKNVTLEHGIPTWMNGEIDISPEKLYNDGKII